MELTIARIGKAHGLRGEVSLELRTDVPEERLAVGSTLDTKPSDRGPLTVARTRVANGRWYALFTQAQDRTAAEQLAGTELVVNVEASDEEDAWYEHELVGLKAELLDGTVVGKIVGLEHFPAQDALVLKETNGTRTYVPFLERFVPTVDIAGGRVVLTPPGGLLSTDTANLVVSDETSGPAEPSGPADSNGAAEPSGSPETSAPAGSRGAHAAPDEDN